MRALLLTLLLASCAPPPAKSVPPRPRQLAETHWVMQAEGGIAAPTLDFSDENRANGFTGCNQWFAQVDRSNGGLSFQAMGITRRACDPAAMELERDFATRLENTRAAEIEDDALTLFGENGETLARFQRAH